MTISGHIAEPSKHGGQLSLLVIGLSIGFTTIALFLTESDAWWREFPEAWELPFDQALSAGVKWLIDEADLGIFTFKQLTRGIGTVLEAPMSFLQGLLSTGFEVRIGGNSVQIPPLSWVGVIALFLYFGMALKSGRLLILIGVSFLYVAFIGLWDSTMLTFASIIVAVVIGIASGVLLGVAAYRVETVDKLLTPVFDFMQTMPVFAYLVPALMLFGYGPAAALVVTLIYAMPPMARVTRVALEQVDSETVEFGRMAGCSRRQLTWKVMLPSIKPRLMVGVNQVIMLTLNMVIIASMIGAGGLGFDVWQSLKALRIGQGAEAGIAITLVAIVLDRISQRYALRRPVHDASPLSFWMRHRLLVVVLSIVLVCTLLSHWIPALGKVPSDWTVTTGKFWDNIIDWININLYVYIGAVRDSFFVYLLKPTKIFMLALPWLGVVATIAAIGFKLGGWRLALTVGSLIAFIAVVGLWEKAMISVYLVGICVALASLIGIPVGVLAARNDRLHNVVQIIIDTLQTLPAFVYLIPVIMLFSVGDFSAMVAVVLYSLVPAIRYTDSGIRQVPANVVEAARAMGCSKAQILRRVQIPLALPDIMLGINQTLMMGLSMLVITALVGTRDLGQETLIALSKVDPGRGLTAGICVAFIAIAADRLINAWAKTRKKELGLDG
ncbi:MAG: ABC transporter permease subunit [Pseudomonadota bacterium]